MSDRDTIRQRTREAAHLQAIEGNPLDADDLAMFEMFDSKGFTPEQEIEYIRADIERRRLAKLMTTASVARRR
jgi:hypothetical protein